MQFVCTLMIIIVASTLGLKPTSAHEYFTLLQSDRIVGLLRDDFLSLIIVSLYLVTFFALYGALRRVNSVYAASLRFSLLRPLFAALHRIQVFPWFTSVTSMRLRQQMHRGLNSWQLVRQLLLQTCGIVLLASWRASSCKVPEC